MNLEGHNLDAYEELLVSIEANLDKLNLLIGICDDIQFRNKIIAGYEAELEEGIACYQITIQPEKPSIRFLLEDLIEQHPEIKTQKRVVVTVLGAEKLRFLQLEGEEKSRVEEFAGYLQWTREALRQFPFSIVLWINSDIEIILKQKAPDFWSWRKGVFRFTTKPRDFVPKEALQPVIQFFGKDAASEYTSLIPLDDLKALIAQIEAKDKTDSRLPALYDSLGRIYVQRLEDGEWRNYQQEAEAGIACFEKALGFPNESPEDVASRLNEIAEIRWLQGKYSEAEPLYTEALGMRKRLFDGDHPDIASSLNNLALLYHFQGRYSEAEPLYSEALAMRKRLFDGDHPDIASSLNNLAGLYYSQGRYSEAEPLYSEALGMTKRLFEGDHPDVANSLNNLAYLYESQGCYSEAEPLLSESLGMRERIFGENHPKTVAVRNNLANLRQKLTSQ